MNLTGGRESTRAIGADEAGSILAEEMARTAETTMVADEALHLALPVPPRMTRKRKESKWCFACVYAHILRVFHVFSRISPRPPSRASSGQASRDTDTAKREDLPKVSESQPDAEIEIPSTPPPVEDIIAARRAKRQAILAKYSGQASQNASPSPMPGNSVDSPLASSAILGSTSPPREIRAPVSSESQMNGKLRVYRLSTRS